MSDLPDSLKVYARLFASMGGKARKEALTKERRQEIARNAGRAPRRRKTNGKIPGKAIKA